MGLPTEFLDRMRHLLGDEYEAYLKSFEQESFQGIRVNTEKINVRDFAEMVPFSLRRVSWTENGFYYEMKDKVTKHPYYYAGLYYVQEPSAMIPASRLPVEEGDFVLDLCAAPGGKATELGARLQGKGMLLANDISSSRAKGLLKNLELFGIKNIYVTSESSKKLKKAYPEYFDKVLIDAPCSGEGMFRRDTVMVKDWIAKGPEYYMPIQRELLLDAADMLKPGGMLLYSTCTFSVKENEENIAFLLENRRDMQLVRPKWNENFSDGKKQGYEDCIRIFPHRAEGEGHFAALLMKRPGEACITEKDGLLKHKGTAIWEQDIGEQVQKGKYPADCPELAEFLKQISKRLTGSLARQKERLYLLPPDTGIKPQVRYLRTGLYLGDIRKKRFEPSQALAMCLKAEEFSNSISFAAEDGRVLRYLKGETLDLCGTGWSGYKGWALVCVDGYGLGWAKAANGMLKNKYYAGWRMQS